MKYNWQQKDWPEFEFSTDQVVDLLFEYSERTGRVSGVMEGLPKEAQVETIIALLVAEAVKTSEIEGEYLKRSDVMSSIRNNLGILKKQEKVHDKRAEGISELMIHAQKTFSDKLTQDTLFTWHQMLMKGNPSLEAGKWRTHNEPMQVISGAMGKEKIHYEAPPSDRIPEEMTRFIRWFNDTGNGGKAEIKKPIIRAAIAHLYFESLHPFEDGNGRIGRAISEKALSQYINRPVLLSLSQAIESRKKDYYTALQKGQRSNEITSWIDYFVRTTLEAQIQAEQLIEFTLKKARFFDSHKDQLNERQLKVIRRILKEGAGGFEGGLNVRKYVSITKTSKATATRDLQDLLEKKIVDRKGGGRSTAYILKLE